MPTSASPPLLFPRLKSRVRVWVSFQPCLLLLLLLSILTPTTTTTSLYSLHCSPTVPASPTTVDSPELLPLFHLDAAYFTGAGKFLGDTPRGFKIRPTSLRRTTTPGTFQIEARLAFFGSDAALPFFGIPQGRVFRRGFHGGMQKRGYLRLALSGFWSETSGKLCAVGSGRGMSPNGSSDLSAVFKLDFPRNSSVGSVFVNGVVESLSGFGNDSYFSPIRMLVYASRGYEFSLVPQVERMSVDFGAEEGVAFTEDNAVCSLINSVMGFDGLRLDYRADCGGENCGPFGRRVGYLPGFVLKDVTCSKGGLVRSYMVFSNSSFHWSGVFLDPEVTLVGEGIWDRERNRLRMLFCRLLFSSKEEMWNASVGDCTIGVSLWFPKFFSLTNRNFVSGRIWSNRSSSDPGFFKMISFHDVGQYIGTVAGMKYEYTRTESAMKSCSSGDARKWRGKQFPDMTSGNNFRFQVSVKVSKGRFGWGTATPFSIGDTIYNNFYTVGEDVPLPTLAETNHSTWNVSYKLRLNYPKAHLSSKLLTDISAEGIYNTKTGMLCMLGCHTPIPSDGQNYSKDDKMDCAIDIKIQLAPLNPEKGEEHILGIIRSTRQKSDPLYYKPLEISSYAVYSEQAEKTIWALALEMMVVLVSLTLSCVCTGLQLFHVKKRSDALPFMSLTMLGILTIGHMVPLVLDSKNLFSKNHSRRNVISWSGQWFEADEVIMRLLTLVAFLIHARLLQLAWSARAAEDGKSDIRAAERKTLMLCVPLYFVVIMITWLVRMGSQESTPAGRISDPSGDGMGSYVGLVIDGFLLPQIMLNMFGNLKDTILMLPFYVGITIARGMPHLYDVYKVRQYIPSYLSPEIYASLDEDLYSNAWNIIIPCVEVVFAVVVYMQQRFGGGYFLPLRFTRHGGYDVVPVAGS